jgi:hypothetical protein
MPPAVLIFSHSITPRLQYTVDLFSQYYGLAFRITSSDEKYIKDPATCKINYSYHRLSPGEIFIHAHSLLSESFIRQVKVECFEHHGYTAFFKAEGDLAFDILAAVFYLVTRYEEYLPHTEDAFGRYAHTNALAFREGFLHLPLVNIWLEDFRHILAERIPEMEGRKTQFRFLPTYDIDMAWSFRNKGLMRNAGAILFLFTRFRFRKMFHRIRVLRRRRPDPFDAYEWMDELHNSTGLKPIYFFLVATEKGRHDKNIDVHNPEFRSLIRSISKKYETGLHPSWHSGDLPSQLPREKRLLESICERNIDTSRQHFIRFQLPQTYQRLIAAGIRHDHSMGYGSINGFRASMATPFLWYDLKHEEKTDLMIHPFCFMDANAFYEEKRNPQQVAAELKQYCQAVQSVAGEMITIWHNSFLGTDPQFAGWREVYEEFVRGVGKSSE